MSGIEVASLALGVVPIFVEILKSYSQAHKKLGTFRRYHKAVKEIQLDYRLEESSFRTECHHLLGSVVDKHELAEMLNEPEDERWHEDDLDRQVQAFLGNDYRLCEEVVVKIQAILHETTKDLQYFDEVSKAAEVSFNPADKSLPAPN